MGSRKEAEAVKCEEVIRSITNRPSPTRESLAALRGSDRGRAARLKRYAANVTCNP